MGNTSYYIWKIISLLTNASLALGELFLVSPCSSHFNLCFGKGGNDWWLKIITLHYCTVGYIENRNLLLIHSMSESPKCNPFGNF